MVLLFIDQSADAQRKHSIEQNQPMEGQGRNGGVDHDQAEILDDAVHRIEQEKTLNRRGIAVYRIEDGGQVRQQREEDVIQILCVAEENVHGGQYQAHANVQQRKAENGIQEHDDLPCEGNSVDGGEEEEHQQCQAEIDDTADVFG